MCGSAPSAVVASWSRIVCLISPFGCLGDAAALVFFNVTCFQASTAVRARALRYRKVAPRSHVDESLFGGSDDDVIPSRSGRVVPRKLSKKHSTGFHEDIVMREDELTKIKVG